MGLRFDPVGGGQLQKMVQQLVEIEKQPIRSLESRKSREEARLKLFQDFKSKFSGFENTLSEFSDFNRFRELKVDLGDGQNQVSITLDKTKAQPGSYTIQIDELAQRSSIISNGFTDPNERVLGIGFVVGTTAKGDDFEIFVDEEHSSLNGIANLINRSSDTPFRASVIKDITDLDRPWKMIISAKNDGYDDHIDFPELYFLDGEEDIYIEDDREGSNALLYLDGFPIEAESNDIPDFIQGLNLHLKAAKPDQPFTISVSEDTQKIAGKVKGLVDQINGILDFINKQNQIDEKSDTRNTFAGDTSLQSVEYRLRNLLHEGFPYKKPGTDGDIGIIHANEFGIEFEKSGSLKFNEEKFTKAIEDRYDAVAQAISGDFGFAHQMREVIRGYTRAGDGLLQIREQGMRSRIKKIDNDIAQVQRRVDQKQAALTEKFARLESSLAKMQSQQQYLAAALPGAGGGNMISQLLG